MRYAVILLLAIATSNSATASSFGAEEDRSDRFTRTPTRDCRSYFPYANSEERETECLVGERLPNGNFAIHGFEFDGPVARGVFGADILTRLYCRPHGFRRAFYQIHRRLLSEDEKDRSTERFFLSVDVVDERAGTVSTSGYYAITDLMCLR